LSTRRWNHEDSGSQCLRAPVLSASVINVASISGWAPQLAMSGQYDAAKAALIFDTERWALEFAPYGIRVNTVSPGSILVESNGWDRYRLAKARYYEDYVRHGFRWVVSAPPRRRPTSSSSRPRRAPAVAADPILKRYRVALDEMYGNRTRSPKQRFDIAHSPE
jgi:NAD(P)-dependent dehydrogenase (short-subunit alcohol dehydrogenase family)